MVDSKDWRMIPIYVVRDGAELVVPVSQVKPGDVVTFGGDSRTVHDVISDDEEETYWIDINGLDLWPAGCFASSKP